MKLRSALCLVAVLAAPACLVSAEKAKAGKIAEAVVPKMNLNGSTMREATEFLSHMSKSRGHGFLNIVFALPANSPKARPPVTLALEQKTARECLQAIVEQSGCELHEEPYAFVVREKGAGPLPPIQVAPDADFAALKQQLEKVVFPKIDVREATPRETFEFITQKSKQLNAPLNLILKLQDEAANLPPPPPGLPGLPGGNAAPSGAAPQAIPGLPQGGPIPARGLGGSRVTLSVENIPVLDLLRYTAAQADLQVTAEKSNLVIAPAKAKK